MTAISEQNDGRFKIFMILDSPVGAYHHYCAQLCNSLIERLEITEVVLVSIFAEANQACISEEELELLDSRLVSHLLYPGDRSKVLRYFAFFKNLFQHLREVSRSSPCVIHIQTATGLQILDTLLPFIYRLLGVPIVRTIHELTAAERIKMPNRFEEWLGKVQLKKADSIIVHDIQSQKRIGDILGEGRPIFVVPHGNYLVFRNFIPNEKETTMPFNNPPVALFLGIKRHKGLEIFLEALQLLQDKSFPIKAKIVGRITQGDDDLLEKINNLRNVEIETGYIPNAQLWKIYTNSDFVVLPYLKGTTSGALHLAYAFKRPVITSDLDCFRELVVDGKTGFMIPKGDPFALAEGIMRICKSREELIHMGEAGFQEVSSETYSWECIAEKTAQVYLETLKQKCRCP